MTYELICPYLTDSKMYAYGAEFGMLFMRMRNRKVSIISDYFCRYNQDQILLLVSRMKWQVIEMGDQGLESKRLRREWFWLSIERVKI